MVRRTPRLREDELTSEATDAERRPGLLSVPGPHMPAASMTQDAQARPLPLTDDLDQMLQVPIVFLGLSLPEHGYHAPNENFDWGQASGGMRAFVKYFDTLASSRP